MIRYEVATYLAWGLWGVSWLLAAFWSDRPAARAGWRAEAPYRLATFAGAVPLFWAAPAPGRLGGPAWRAEQWHWLVHPLWVLPASLGWSMLAVTVAGFAVAWWARLHLGRYWSATVGRKAAHKVVDTGPYRLVRHPIYTGIILSFAALAAERGSAAALLGLVLLVFSFWLKARLEERFLRRELGAEAYDAYRRRTPMLVPFA
ncbi:MAG: DUF1295 domain-containing protein [Alphaproteobacteria bacterium]|nr:DUF1295 domain-containing protein [Alphaproteobacteria bacterium]